MHGQVLMGLNEQVNWVDLFFYLGLNTYYRLLMYGNCYKTIKLNDNMFILV